MTTNVGSVNINVTANTDPLDRSLAASAQAVQQYSQTLSQSMSQSSASVASSTASAGGDVEEFSSGSLGMIEGFAAGFSAAITGFVIEKLVEMGATFMEIATRGMEFAGEVNTAMKTVQVQTGASAEEMVALKDSMMGVYSSGLVGSMEESAAAISAVKRITGETGDALIATTTDALAFGQAFDKEVTEVMAGARGMMNGFGISAQESMDLAAYAIQKTGDPAGDLLDTLTEYSPLMSQIGLDAEQFTAALIGGLEGGAFNTDQLGDALKEFGIGLMEDISVVGPKMTEVLAAAGDEGAQAWLGIRAEIKAASEEVNKHKSVLDEAKGEWDKTNAAVQQYQGELDKAMGKLMQALNPNLDLSKYTDTLRSLEQEAIQIKLTMPDDTPAIEAAKSRMEDALGQIDKEGDGITSRIKELQQQARKASEAEKAAIESKITALEAEKEQLGARRDAIREGFDAEMDAYKNSPQQQRLDEIKRLSEQQTLLMKQEQLAAQQIALNAAKSKGLTEGEIKGQVKLGDVQKATLDILKEIDTAQQNLGAASADESVAKQQLDQAQMSYDQALAIVKDLELTAEQMSNPGEALGLAFQKGGADAAAAMKQFASSLLKAKETMSDADFKALAREAGFGTLAEEMGADALAGVLQGIVDPGNIAKDAAGTVKEAGKVLEDGWVRLWNKMDAIIEPFGQKIATAFNRVLPVLEKLADYAAKVLPPILDKLGVFIDNLSVTMMPFLEAIGMGALDALTSFGGLGGVVMGFGATLATLIPTAVGLWAAIAPMFAMLTGGALTTSLTAFGATLMATFATIGAPLLLAGAAVAAFALAWSTNFGGVRDITLSVMTAISAFVAERLAFMVAWWTKYGADVMVVVNGFLAVVQTVFGAIMLFITTAIEGYRLLWAKFGDDIMAIINVAVSNATLIFQGFFLIIGELFGIFADLIKGNWSGVWEHFVNIMTIQKDVIMGIWNNILGLFGTSIEEIVKFFADLPGKIAAYFSPEALIQIATDAMQAFGDTITAMMPSLPSPSDFIGDLPSLSGAMSSAQNLVGNTAASLSGAIPSPTSTTLNQSLSFPQPNADIETIRRVVRQDTIRMLQQTTG